jgi:hypothetical protein
MLRDKNNIALSNVGILSFSLIFALLVGSGLYGYGVDYFSSYYKENLDWGGVFDRTGYRIVTLAVNGVHVGVHITTFLLSLSVGLLIRENLRLKLNYSLAFFILLYLIVIHTWPIIMSTSNAMRQGLTMSFIFLALISSSRKNYVWLVIFILVSIFMHKSGLLLSMIVLFATYLNNLLRSVSFKRRRVMHFLFGTLLLITFYAAISYNFDTSEGSKIIEGDFRAAFVLISFSYVILSFVHKSLINGPYNLTLYYYSFMSPSVLMNGLNWEFERLGMMMLIPYILAIGTIFDRTLNKFYLIIVFLALFFLTIITGMYEIGLTSWEEYCTKYVNIAC